MGNMSIILNIIKAARLNRTFTGIIATLIPVSIAGKYNFDIFIFCLSSVILYSAVAIHNAKKDNDYELPDYIDKIMLGLLIISILLSMYKFIIFVGVIVLFILGILYNVYSRYIIMGDATIVAFSHIAWPIFLSSYMLGLSSKYLFRLPIFLYVIFWFYLHLKNLKDEVGDAKRGYKTIMTEFKKGREITMALSQIGMIFMVTLFYVFNFKYKIIFTFFMSLLFLAVTRNIIYKNDITVANLLKSGMVFYFSLLIFENAGFSLVSFISAIPVILYGYNFIKPAFKSMPKIGFRLYVNKHN